MMQTGQKAHKWTDEERDYLRQNYAHTIRSRRALAERFGVTPSAVYAELQWIGVVRPRTIRPWTQEEDDKLLDLIGRYNIRQVAYRLKRTVSATRHRATLLRASTLQRDGWYTAEEAAAILGMDSKTLLRHKDRGRIAAKHHHAGKPATGGAKVWHISAKALKHFVCSYPYELQGRNVDMVQLVDLLAGVAVPHYEEAEVENAAD